MDYAMDIVHQHLHWWESFLCTTKQEQIDGLKQKYSTSIANALTLLQFCSKPPVIVYMLNMNLCPIRPNWIMNIWIICCTAFPDYQQLLLFCEWNPLMITGLLTSKRAETFSGHDIFIDYIMQVDDKSISISSIGITGWRSCCLSMIKSCGLWWIINIS